MDSFNIGLSSVIKNDQVPAMDQVERIRFTGPEAYEIFMKRTAQLLTAPGIYILPAGMRRRCLWTPAG